MAELALKMSNIYKSFGTAAPVLTDVTFSVNKGEIHGLLGENGAGKSTLMNILGGVIKRNSGTVEIDGKEVEFDNAKAAQDMGIAFIHQELNVVNDMPVYENMFLGSEVMNGFRYLQKNEMHRRSQEVFDRMEVDLKPNEMVENLPASSKQILEIAKALLHEAKIIIMDEPTTSLSIPEIENVFQLMRKLAADGVAIIFISHKLGEVVEICDRYTVLNNGVKVGEGNIENENGEKIDPQELACMMVGRDVKGLEIYQPRETGEVVLKVEHLSCGRYFQDISFEVHKGEILGMTGLLGAGTEEVVRCLFGDLPVTEGSIYIHDKKETIKNPMMARKKGIGFLPSNRKENAIIKDLTITENTTIVALDKCTKGIHLDHREERKVTDQYKGTLNIKYHKQNDLITSLSGGNQQKIVLAKWMFEKPEILLLCNPTQGVDVGAKNDIYEEIFEIAKTGVAVVVTSGEAQEVMKVCDRVKVLYHGTMAGTLEREDLSEERIMIMSTGADRTKETSDGN